MTSLTINPDDLIVWANGNYCRGYELADMTDASDDFEVVRYGTGVHLLLSASLSGCRKTGMLSVSLSEILREAATVIASIPVGHEPENMRPLLSAELEGFAIQVGQVNRPTL